MTPARELSISIGGCLVGAAVVLLAAGRPWAVGSVSRGTGLPVATVALTGRDLAPAVFGLAILALAAVAALVATRRTVRRAVGVLVALAGAVVLVASVRAGAGAGAAAAVEVSGAAAVTVELQPWSWMAAAGGLLMTGAGLLAAARGGRWPSMSGRYDRPRSDPGSPADPATSTGLGDQAETVAATPEDMWRTLDRGDDPTDESAATDERTEAEH